MKKAIWICLGFLAPTLAHADAVERLQNLDLIAALHPELKSTERYAQLSELARLEAETKPKALALPKKLHETLTQAIQDKGVVEAVSFCNITAPKAAQAFKEKEGWQIRRASIKNRNPKAKPDAYEAEIMADFEAQIASGRDIATLEHSGFTEENGQRYYRYIKALPTQPMCLNCHGDKAEMQPDLSKRIGELYPNDMATGFSVGQMRGVLSLKRQVDNP